MPESDDKKPDEKQVNETAAAKQTDKSDNTQSGVKVGSDAADVKMDGNNVEAAKPLPHEIAKALDNDVMLMLDAVVHAATDDTLRRCPSLASICQAYQINRQSMIDWLERVKFREEQREERRKEAADDKEA